MKKPLCYLPAAVLLATGFLAPALIAGELTHDQVATTKMATALLVDGDGSGTAFCISESGVFVTCNHVVEDSKPGSLFIVIDPAQKDEKKYPARVLRNFPKADLAVLKVDLDRKIPVLKLGDDAAVVETQQIFAFGYPFGLELAKDEKSYPAISVNSGHVTSLRKEGDTLDAIQLDAMLNPGNSGGPVLDERGEVVGIVAFGLYGSGVNFAIPVSRLKKEMNAPVLTVNAPDVKFDDRFKPADFTITVDWLTPPPVAPGVNLEITSGGQTRTVAAAKGNDGKYHASVPPLVGNPAAQKVKLHVTLEFEGGVLSGQVDDFWVTVNGKPVLLSQIQTITPGDKGAGYVVDGVQAGALPGLGTINLDVGGAVTPVDARKAKRISIVAPGQDAGPVTYKVTVTAAGGGAALATEQGTVTIHSSPVIAGPSQLTGTINLTEKQVIQLPSPADDVVAAQDGRSLVFHLKDVKKLAVFDVVDLKIRGFINLASEPVVFGGGSRSLVVAYPSQNIIERYSLQTLQKDKTITNPTGGEIANLAMGYSSPRYAVFVAKGERAFDLAVNIFNVDTMRVEASSKNNNKFNMLSGGGSAMLVRASGDGRTYGFYRLGISPTGFSVVSYKNDQLSLFYEHESTGILVPNADGTGDLTGQTGVYTSQYVSVLKEKGNWAEGVCYLPSYNPAYFIGVPYSEMDSNQRNQKHPKPIAVYTDRSAQPLAYLDPFDEMSEKDGGLHSNTPSPMTPDKRYHFYPQLNLFITIPATNDRVVARPINLKKILDDKGIDYLYATTVAPQARVSQHYNFKIEAASRAGGVTFALQSGPNGLTVASDGMVNWQASAKPTEEAVIVSMKDSSGQQAYYTFQLVVTE